MSERCCPACAGELTSGRLGPVALDLCLPCGGVWFLADALRQLLDAGPDVIRRLAGKLGDLGVRSPSAQLACPQCRRGLSPTASSSMPGVVVHACGTCRGFWLSRDALLQLALLQERGKADVAAAAPTAAPVRQPGAAEPAGRGGAGSQRGACPDCGEVNGPGAGFCWACGRLLQGVAARCCPCCNGIVRRVEGFDVRAGACESCGGAWFGKGQLNALLFLTESEQQDLLRAVKRLQTGRPRPARSPAECPDCGIAMPDAPVGNLSARPVPTCPSCTAHFLAVDLLEELVLGKKARPRPLVRVVG